MLNFGLRCSSSLNSRKNTLGVKQVESVIHLIMNTHVYAIRYWLSQGGIFTPTLLKIVMLNGIN